MNTSSKPIQVYLLGKFEVCRAGRVLRAKDWSRRKAAALFQRLSYERRLLKDQAVESLWPESQPASGQNNLYRILHVLRKTLDQGLGEGASGELISFEDGVLILKDRVWVDVHEFERMCQVIPAEPAGQRFERFAQALTLYQGDFLPDELYTDWTVSARNALSRLYREVSLSVARRRLEQQDFPAAAGLLTTLLAKDPADEQAHQELMRLYARAGRRQEALRQYQVYRDALQDELGVGADPETHALYQQILIGEYPPQQEIPEPDSRLKNGNADHQPLTSLSHKPSEQDRGVNFIGREREISWLEERLKRAVMGEGGVVFISGEAGLGKTSLMAEFAYRAQARYPDLIIAAAACQALTGYADPYLPFRDLVALLSGDMERSWLGGDISASHRKRLGSVAPQTLQILSTRASGLVNILVPGELLPKPPLQAPTTMNQGQVFEQMRHLLHSLAQDQPLLLLLDDLQWADAASTNLLFHLGRQLATSSILILGAYRPSELSGPAAWQVISDPASSHPLASVIQELVRFGGEASIDLDAYTPDEGRSFVDALLDSEPNQLGTSFREAVFRRTKGQPLFTVELLRALQEQGDLVKDEDGQWKETPDLDWDILPARVEAVIARRIEQLPLELRQLLAVGSVEGEYFSVEVLAQVHEKGILPLLQYLSQELDRRYRLVRESGMLHLGSQTITRYQFRHNLFQQYIYHQLSTGERRYLHGAVAAALERIGRDELDDMAVTLAHHFSAAGQVSRAAVYLCRAGDQARRRMALEEAVHFYQAALDHSQEQEAAARAEVLHKLGETQIAIGKSGEAIETLIHAEKLYAQASNLTARGAVQRLIGRSYWEQAQRAKAMIHYQEALALLEGGPDEAELARAVSAISQMKMLADEYDQAVVLGERALALAQKLQVEDVRIHSLTNLGISRIVLGDVDQGMAMLEESKERAQAAGSPHDACRAYTGMGDSLIRLERHAEARQVYEQMLSYSRKVQAAMFEGVALVQLGYLDWWGGRWRQALKRGMAIQTWMDDHPGITIAKVWAGTFLGCIYNDLGQPAKARAVLAEYTPVARKANEPQTTIPHLRELTRLASSEKESSGLVREILDMVDSTAYPRYEIMPGLILACNWLAKSSAGDVSALKLLELTHERAQNQQSAASLYEVKGYAAGLRGEWREAVYHYQEAAESWDALGWTYDVLRVWTGLIPALKQIGDRVSMNESRERALSLVEQLASELDDPEQRGAFLASPLVARIRGV